MKLNIVSSFQLKNKKRYIMSQSSSIKLKIENSGNQKIYSSNTYSTCESIVSPDEIYINGENQIEIKSLYNFENNNNNEIILKWNNPLSSTSCIFKDCTSITEIDLSNFDDSQLIKMQYMFMNCQSLKKIEISNIHGNKVNDAGYLFRDCVNLESIDLANFKAPYNVYLHHMFENCKALTSLNYPNFNPNRANYIDNFFYNCNNLKYINFENAIIKNETIPIFNIINSNYNICTHSPALITIIEDNSATLNCENNYCINQIEEDDCSLTNYKYKYNNKFHENCPDGTYNNNFNCIDCDEKCSLCSKESTEQNLCLSCNNIDNYYEKYIESVNHDSLFKECLKSPKGFYLDSTNLLYKPCYHSCLSCDKNGNEEYHNCIECKDEYKFILKFNNYYNCYSACPNYYYIEENNNDIKYICTLNSECPDNYNKFIPDLGKCIDKCEKDDNYKYEYRNQCFNDCPERTMRNNNYLNNDNKYFCKPICNMEEPFEVIKEQKCVKYCTTEEIKRNICTLNFKNINLQNSISIEDILMKNFENYFTSKDYNTTKIEQGEEEIYQEEEFTVTFTSSENQKNNINNNMTKIDLGQCEMELRNFYNLSDNKTLFMKKIDINIPGMKIPKVLFDVYCKLDDTNLIKLNLSSCQNSRVEISIPIKITENLDKLNSSSAYYNDICYITTSECGTDISLEDRKKDFVEENKTICQEDCYFSEYDPETHNAKCSCKIKEFELINVEMKIDKESLYKNFIDINNIANIKIMKCYKVLFNKRGIIKNICFYIVSAIILFHIINIIIFYNNQKYSLYDKIKGIISDINNSILDGQKKQRKTKMKKYKQIYKIKNINIKSRTKNKIINQNSSKQEILNKKKKIMKYNDEEINSLDYQDALEYDKRTYCEYYISLLKTKNNLIYSFCYNNDYNSKIIKIDLFFIGFTLFFTVNAIFFDDSTMHQIYEDKGSFNLLYQLPQIIYSTFISSIVSMILEFLALSEGSILNLKNNKENRNLNQRVIKLKKKLNIKFSLYFILSFLLLLLFWYYLSMFCSVYRNTQIHLIKDTLISFLLSFISPFVIYLVPGIFRIPALTKSKSKRYCLYNFSKLLQMF